MSDFVECALLFGVLAFICEVIYLNHRNKIKVDDGDYYSGITLVAIIMVIVMFPVIIILLKLDNCLLVSSGLHLVLIMIGANIFIPKLAKSQCYEKVEEGKFDYITVLFLIALLSNAVCAWFYFDSKELLLTYLSIILGKFVWFDAEGMTSVLCKAANLVKNGFTQLKNNHKFMLRMEVIACVATFGGLIYQKYDQTGTASCKINGALVGIVVSGACLVLFGLLKDMCTRNRQGIYLNPGNNEFGRAINSETYVDETDMISYANKVICAEQKYVCVSCHKGFGQPLLAEMLVAYYSRGCNSQKMFKNLKVARCTSYEQHINKYNVIFLNMQEFLNESNSIDANLRLLIKSVYSDLFEQYPEYCNIAFNNLLLAMRDIYQKTKCPFLVIIDEWDCVIRKYRGHVEYEKYFEFLKKYILYKEYIALVYMIGTVPINMYGTYYKLDEFNGFSIMNSQQFVEFIECDELVK